MGKRAVLLIERSNQRFIATLPSSPPWSLDGAAENGAAGSDWPRDPRLRAPSLNGRTGDGSSEET